MMMNRVLIRVYVPLLEKKYDVWVPINKKVYEIIINLIKGINSINKIEYDMKEIPNLYDKESSEVYDINAKIIDTNIRNGSEVILL